MKTFFRIFFTSFIVLLVVMAVAMATHTKAELHLLLNSHHTEGLDTFFRYYTTLAEFPLYIIAGLALLFNGDIGQILSRLTWEAPQTYIGYTYSQVKNYIGEVDRVDYYGGAIFCTNENADENDGVTIGNYINININDKIDTDFDTYLRTAHNGLYMHEYGHTFQSKNYGFLYLPYIGIQSLVSAKNSHEVNHPQSKDTISSHRLKWYEREASAYARRHFGEDWWNAEINKEHPTYGFLGF